MGLKIIIHVDPHQFAFSVPQINWSEQMPNIIALNKDDRICAIGAEAAEMNEADDSEQWQEKHQIRFINPFEFDSYGVLYAPPIIDFFVNKALKNMRRGLSLGHFFTRCDFDLWLWNYDLLSVETKYEFETALRKRPLLKVGNVSIIW